MSNAFTRFKLGVVTGPTYEGPANDFHVYDFPAEFERPSRYKSEQIPVHVRFRSIQVYNRDPELIKSLAHWIAECRVIQHFAEGAEEPPTRRFDVDQQEVDEFFREVDPAKIDIDCWIDLSSPPKKIGF